MLLLTHRSVLSKTSKLLKQNLTRIAVCRRASLGALTHLCKSGAPISVSRMKISPPTRTHAGILLCTTKMPTTHQSAGTSKKDLIHPAALKPPRVSAPTIGPSSGNGAVKFALTPAHFSHTATSACHPSVHLLEAKMVQPELLQSYLLLQSWLF